MELNDLNDFFNLEYKFFRKTDSFQLIEQKCTKKCLTQDERQALNSDIHYAFEKLIKTIKEACPNLTEEDVIFCCLEKSGLDHLTVCHCMGSASKEIIKQRKYRIKKKMKEAGCEKLFDMIFTT